MNDAKFKLDRFGAGVRAIVMPMACAMIVGGPDGYAQAPMKEVQFDVCVYGATAGGVMAALAAKKLGHSVVLVEPTRHIGGMTSAGLGATDIGNKFAITGMAKQFYRDLGKQYGRFEAWNFEPSVAEAILKDYLTKAGVDIYYERRILEVQKEGTRIKFASFEHAKNPDGSGAAIAAKQYIDASCEGDLMAKAGVSYMVGREANKEFGETYNGVQYMQGHQMPDSISPYRIEGDAKSGLVWGVTNNILFNTGIADKKLQAYCYRLCLTNEPKNRLPILRPIDYDSTKYELLRRIVRRYKIAEDDKASLNRLFIIRPLENGKADWNNKGGFSLDMLAENWGYAEANYAEREAIVKKHESFTRGLLYFMGNDAGLPKGLRNQMLEWGWPKDEFVATGGLPHQLYIREARRMRGEYVMTQKNCERKEVVEDGVGMAAYTMDSHNAQRIVLDGWAKNEGNVEALGAGPYPISYRALVPKATECSNLSVPVCLSASHIAYGSIRMEPVFMVLGQSCGLAAHMAIAGNTSIQEVDIAALQARLKAQPLLDNSVADIVIDNSNVIPNDTKGIDWYSVPMTGEVASYGIGLVENVNLSQNEKMIFRPEIKIAGLYDVYFYKGGEKGKSAVEEYHKKAPVTVRYHAGGEDFELNLQTNRGEWQKLGQYYMEPLGYNWVEVKTDGSGKKVIADAVQFVYAGPKQASKSGKK